MIAIPPFFTILVVDDEPDMYALTQLALRSLRYLDREILIEYAPNGEAALNYLREHPETAIVLMDVVMESDHAGLMVSKHIRQTLHNEDLRILLRTGQPGVAPEKTVIREYEIDGYLPKAEMTHQRLFSAVYTALKSYVELRRSRYLEEILGLLYQSMLVSRQDEALESTLQQILETAVEITETPLGLLSLHLSTRQEPYLLYTSALEDAEETDARIALLLEQMSQRDDIPEGLIVRLGLPPALGHGWIYLDHCNRQDSLLSKVVPLLANHAANLLYRKFWPQA